MHACDRRATPEVHSVLITNQVLTAPDTFGLVDSLDPWRVKTLRLVRSWTFQQFINLFLVASTVCLAMERRVMGLQERNALDVTNLVLNVIFTVEFLLKGFAFSFSNFLKDPLNRLDFLIVFFGVIDVVLSLLDPPLIKNKLEPASDTEIFGAIRILRIVKTMRPLRLILFRMERVRIVANAMVASIGPLQLAASIAMILVMVFALFAQQLLAGEMSACSDPAVFHHDDCTGVDSTGLQRIFRPAELNCNWIGDSVILMFTAISKDRWRQILWSITDVTGRNTGPYMDRSWWYATFLLFAVVMGSIFTLNLLIALFVESYTKEMIRVRQKINDTPLCLQIQGRQSLPRLWDRPRTRTRAAVLDVLESKSMKRFFTLVFFANFVIASTAAFKSVGWVTTVSATHAKLYRVYVCDALGAQSMCFCL